MIVVSDSKDLRNFFDVDEHLVSNQLLPPFALYVYLLSEKDAGLAETMQAIWRYRGIPNQLVLLRNGSMVRFQPFRNSENQLENSTALDFSRIPVKLNGISILVQITKRDMNNFVLFSIYGKNSMLRPLVGPMGDLLSLMIRILDCRLTFVYTDENTRFDMTYSMRSAYENFTIDLGPPMFWFRRIFVVPAPKELPPWQQMMLTFPLQLWLGIGAAYACSVLAWFAVGRLSCPQGPPSLLRSAAHTVRVLVAMDWPRSLQVASRGGPQRALLSGLMLFSLVLVTTFQSSLVDIIRNPRKTMPLETMEDLEKSNLPVYFMENDAYNDYENPIFKSLLKRKLQTHFKNYLMAINEGYDFAMTDNDVAFKTFTLRTKLSQARQLKEVISVSFTSFLIPLRSALTEAITRAVYVGRQSRLLEDELFERNKQSFILAGIFHSTSEEGRRPYSVNHVKGPLVLLIVGLSLSIIVFIFEIIFSKKKQKGICQSSVKI